MDTVFLCPQIPNLRFRTSDSKPQIQNLRFRTSDSKPQIPNLRFRTSDSEPQIQNLRFQTSEPYPCGYGFLCSQIQNLRFRTSEPYPHGYGYVVFAPYGGKKLFFKSAQLRCAHSFLPPTGAKTTKLYLISNSHAIMHKHKNTGSNK
jgi:hypothetical protein